MAKTILCNILYLLTAQLFTTKKKKRLRNLVPAAKYMMSRRQGRNLRTLFKLRKLEAYLVTFVTVFNLHTSGHSRHRFRSFSILAPRSCDFLRRLFFQTIIDIKRERCQLQKAILQLQKAILSANGLPEDLGSPPCPPRDV